MMTQGLRKWRALGVGVALLVGTVSGCLTPDKKPVPNRKPVGPATPGGGLPNQIMPPNSRTGAPAGAAAPSVQPGAQPTTTSGFGSMNSPLNSGTAPMSNYTPGMQAPTPQVNPAAFQQPAPPAPTMPGVTSHSSANYQSMGQQQINTQLATATTPSGMSGSSAIPMVVTNLPPSPPMDMDLSPPQPPGQPMQVVPPGSGNEFVPIAPTPPGR